MQIPSVDLLIRHSIPMPVGDQSYTAFFEILKCAKTISWKFVLSNSSLSHLYKFQMLYSATTITEVI